MEMGGQFYASAVLFGTHWIEGWVDLRAGLDKVKKRNPFPCQESFITAVLR
jgi:hypothetical protein